MAARPKMIALALTDLFAGAQDPEPGKDRVPPAEFKILSAGINSTTKGQFLFDDLSAAAVMGEFERHKVDLSIDYDHAAVTAGMGGGTAPAAGWFRLEVRSGELWAMNVRWTPAGDAHLRAGEYRYFSPLMNCDDATGRVLCLFNLALTNMPAMDGIDALVAASARALADERDHHMNEELQKALARIKQLETDNAAQATELATLRPAASQVVALSAVVGFAGGSSPSEVQGRVTALAGFQRDVVALSGQADPAGAIGAINGWKAAAGELATLKTSIATEKATALSQQLTAALDDGCKTGKLEAAPTARSMRDRGYWDKEARERGVEVALSGLTGYLAAVSPPAAAVTPPAGALPVDAGMARMLRLNGQDPAKFIAWEAARLAAGAAR
jgi:phage I-like protein